MLWTFLIYLPAIHLALMRSQNFVQIVDAGANSNVFVDVTGTATFGAGTQVATLYGINGITDEVALETSGHLIT